MTNPFDDPDAEFRVLANTEGQHSLWPAFADVPAGWTTVFGPGARSDCIGYVTENWKDIRPRSLAG